MNTQNVSFQSFRLLCSRAKARLLPAAFLVCVIGSTWAQNLPKDILPEDTIAFQGSLVANEEYRDYAPSQPTLPPLTRLLFFVTANGTAQVAGLGEVTVIYAGMMDYTNGAGQQCARFIDASGDSIFTTATQQAGETSDPMVRSILEIHSVTGGTGYYTHVNGSFTVQRLIKFSADGVTGISHGTFNGYLRTR